MRSLLAKNWFLLVLSLGVSAALGVPRVVDTVTGVWEPRQTVAFSLFLVAWTMPTQSLVAELKHPFASAWAVLLSYGLVPIAAWSLGFLTADADVRIGLILVASVPCTLSTAVLWTRLAGGNEATALLTVMGTTCISWLVTTAWLSLLTGADVVLDVPGMMRDLFLSLIVPVVVGQGLRLIPASKRFAEHHKVAIGTASQLFVLAIVLKAAVSVGDRLHDAGGWEAPRIFVDSVVLAVVLHLLSLGSGLWSSRWLGFDRGRQIAIAFASSQKTLQVSLVLYEFPFKDYYPFAVLTLLFYHVGQLLLDTMIAKRLRR